MRGGPHFIEARIRYLTAGEGGRTAPVASGYRGQFHYAGEPDTPHDGFQYFPYVPAAEFVSLGSEVRALVRFDREMWDGLHAAKMRVGTRFTIQEGRKVVGEGVVTGLDAGTPTIGRS
jgi:translation elongation factor EF-Tu-like GTPase